ncbi:hypothetical protein SPI_03606 [Niveomyces insectorum RCEF 264]|uniref:Uncharacterized protein n=1 Tax=Niveomyces insectorum RCEF 264 TaxID=1081102 RepID=A0A167W7S6_9HYPO|nr:hypothetical protein SPI_03606 [Niveomyces insectorum RCEF 264]
MVATSLRPRTSTFFSAGAWDGAWDGATCDETRKTTRHYDNALLIPLAGALTRIRLGQVGKRVRTRSTSFYFQEADAAAGFLVAYLYHVLSPFPFSPSFVYYAYIFCSLYPQRPPTFRQPKMRILRTTATRTRRPQKPTSKKQTVKRTAIDTIPTYKNIVLRRHRTKSARQQETTTAETTDTNRPLRKARGNVPRNPTASGSELAAFLYSLQTDDGPAVFPRVISFANDTERKGWIASIPDAKERATILEFLRHPLRTKRGRLALISCPTDNWVQQKDKPSGDQGT